MRPQQQASNKFICPPQSGSTDGAQPLETPWRQEKHMKRSLFRSLYFQVVVALIAGIAVGHFYPAIATDMKPIGDAFINGIKMVITPVVFCTIVSGIAGMESLKKVGRVGGKAVLYFEVVTTLALIIGMIVANV